MFMATRGSIVYDQNMKCKVYRPFTCSDFISFATKKNCKVEFQMTTQMH